MTLPQAVVLHEGGGGGGNGGGVREENEEGRDGEESEQGEQGEEGGEGGEWAPPPPPSFAPAPPGAGLTEAEHTDVSDLQHAQERGRMSVQGDFWQRR